MSTNLALARIFEEIATALEISGAMVFKVNANRNVARLLEHLTVDVGSLADDKKKLTAIEGIGDGSARKIIEFVQTGSVAEHEELLKKVPRGLMEVTRIPGVGPKTAKLLFEQCGVCDVPTLKAKIAAGELLNVPRLGEKTLQNIAKSLAFLDQSAQRTRLGEALPLAESIMEFLTHAPATIHRLEFAGSLRRGQETIGDVDILAATDDHAALVTSFTTMPMVQQVLASGPSKASVRLARGVQVDLRIVPLESFGAALLYFTGSKQHNVALRERALKKGFTLNEYGLYPEDKTSKVPPQQRGVKPKAADSEHAIYKALGLPFIPPELREDRGEFDKARAESMDNLVKLEDIKAELHAHTRASDGSFTIDGLIEEAKARGFHTIAITDHSKSSVQANGLSVDRLLKHIDDIREAAGRHKKITVLAGAEVDILIDGRLDYDDNLLARLDIVVASPHASLKQDSATATTRLLGALRHPLVHILGHPTGRIINRREGLSPDIHQLIAAAVEHDKALEINANHLRLDLRDSHVRAAVQAGALIAIDTDAHSHDDFDELRYGVLTARRGWVTADRCINAWPKAKLHKWIKAKR